MVRFLSLVLGVIAGVFAIAFVRAEDWGLAAGAGTVTVIALLLAAFSRRGHGAGDDQSSTPDEDGRPAEGGVPTMSATPPPASTA